MNQQSSREIEKRLRPEPVESPLGLADTIKDEIPERPQVVPWPMEESRETAVGRRWAIAATIAVAVIGAGLTYRVASRVAAPAFDQPVVAETQRDRSETHQPAAGPDESVRFEAPSGPALQPGSADLSVSVGEASESVSPTGAPSRETLSGSEVSRRDTPAPSESPRQRDPFVADALEADAGQATAARSAPPAPRDTYAEQPRQRREKKSLVAPPPPPESGLFSMRDSSVAPSRVAPRHPQAPPAETPGYGVPPSTGGTTEPNDQPYGDMFFRPWGVNPFIDTEDDKLSTFGLDVDTGSYTLTRSYIERGHLPPVEAIRVEEFINYFDYRDAAPLQGDFSIHAESAPSPFASGPRYRLLRFGLRGREIAAADRLPATLVFVVDVSGSMDRENRLGLVKSSLSLLLDQLRPDDRVGLVVYGSRGRVLLQPTGDLEAIRSAIGYLQAEGSTNAEEGLLLGYELAERYHREGTLHRVVLCSDGVANVGRTGPESILARVRAATGRGIELTTVGFGMGNYNDLLMEQLADNGDGSYAYVDTLDEARRVFVENLTGTLQTIAAEAKVQVEFDPSTVARYRLLGYENRDIADERFRDDSVDAGEIGAGHAVTALYEIKLHEGVGGGAELATLRLRYESKAAGEIVEIAEPIRLRDGVDSWEAASPALRLASLVAEFGEILRESYWAKDGDLDDLFVRVQRLSGEFAGDVDVADFVSLVGRAARLRAAASR